MIAIPNPTYRRQVSASATPSSSATTCRIFSRGPSPQTKKNDPQRAIKYYRAVAAAVPEEAKGWSLLCAAYEKAQDRERAMRACKYAVDRRGVALADYGRYVGLFVSKPGDLTSDEKGELKGVLDHLDKQPELAVPTAHLRCQVAVKTKDVQDMQACTAVLAKVAPDDPKTVVFQWSLAVMRGDAAEASRLIGRAQQLAWGRRVSRE